MGYKKITLSNIGESSLQEIFDWVVHNALTQAEKSYDGDSCLYRSYLDDVCLKCFVGFCISDEEYDKSLEHSDAAYILSVKGIDVGCEKERFLKVMQELHDRNYVSNWFQSFVSISTKYDLEFNFDLKDYPKYKSLLEEEEALNG